MTDEHRQLREQLGSYALGHLPGPEAVALRSHLDGCAPCRADLAEIAPLAADLATVDLARLGGRVSPPASLGAAIGASVAAESLLRDARARRERRTRTGRRALAAAAAIAVLGGSVASTAALVRPDAAVVAAPAVPAEPVAVIAAAGVSVTDAGLVPHTWGVEVKLVATGLESGGIYRAAFRSRSGELLPAGEFLGVGENALTCNLQAALLRADAVGFVVTDAGGAQVLSADL